MKTITLKDYIPIVGKTIVENLFVLAKQLKSKTIQNVNSTRAGGGVAEILNRIIPLLQELGVDARWDVIKGNDDFFRVTKRFHNVLHSRKEILSDEHFNVFLETSEKIKKEFDIYGDIVFIHDPQPISLIDNKKKNKKNKWIWRCHIDVSNPHKIVWNFLEQFISRYDAVVFSAPKFSHPLTVRQFLIAPSIDPLSDKNKKLSKKVVAKTLEKFNIPDDKPIISQISRFDYLKDPVGVIHAYKLVKKYIDCRLVLAGGTAADDPEYNKVIAEVKEAAGKDEDIHILLLPPNSNIEINALQRASNVILQKSIKEGFGLTVAEALWKETPVVASAVGGIPLQIKHKYSGLLSYSIEGTAFCIKQLLNSPEYAKHLAKNAKEHIKQNFLLTRHLRDYMLLFLSLYQNRDVIYF